METAVKTKWNLDTAHSEIGFKVKHMMISTVTGHFEDFNATVATESDDFKNANFDFVASIGSINTKNTDRDNHLKSNDFFNAEAYPEMTFKSTSFDGEKMIGDLTIRDITKKIELDVDFNGIAVDPYGQTKAGFEITGTINRKDFGLVWSAVTEAGSVVVAEQVKLVVDLQFIQE
ncbi:YceI family protein [Flagellimonas meridianipacifica]|uniref:Polyisoprenoid-binding protein YceI n=1 Tax=Flagellimonas meridianipacifica TaxID=1080225 RepID=A0A2T0MJ73_9FLAO|nr:YceI family protein [Allomuricauda pacifica]PRX57609.1 polyisoprenoid-binding protein YceI [Allomuricauda pacifica]